MGEVSLFQWPKVNVSRVGEYIITTEEGENIPVEGGVNITVEGGENITAEGGENIIATCIRVMGIPSPSERTFVETKSTIEGMWEELAAEILVAGKEEKSHAEAMGQYDEGIPAIFNHTAAGRMTSCLESFLCMALPRKDILKGYLLFEVLSAHQYEYY
ncbi:Hypp9630 [Branchiostoma lanceolatum]|uniref:Hypp9630 protein n=1 Tax=Branchiostoma lanceolatum TaxID=7740 RepID=A0A8S4MNT1_BRALA|nr:Hypp9630 [Branchiostoma lanceolatum]